MPNEGRPTQPRQAEPLAGQPGLRLRLARVALLWEQIWPGFWPAMAVAALFAILVLADLLPLLPGWLHLAVLVAFAAAFVFGLWRAVRALRIPDAVAARRRLERESGLAHRPLTALQDRLVAGSHDPEATALWQAHRRRLRAEMKRLRVGVPRAGLAKADPVGLRAALLLLLIVLGLGAWGDGFERLGRAFQPAFAGLQPDTPAQLDIWITPPAYTGLPPTTVQTAAPQPGTLAVPEGSTVLAQVQGGEAPPRLSIGEVETAFDTLGPDTYRATAQAVVGDSLAVEQDGRLLGRWPLQIVPDEPPGIDFAKPPAQTERAALRLEYAATDDYGLEAVQAVITRAEEVKGGPSEPIELTLPLPGLQLKTARGASYHDLTPHPWAGLPAKIRLVAKDARGQTGTSETLTITLPERAFHHPVARAIVEQRKHLTVTPRDRVPVTRNLNAIAARPDLFGGDIVVVLGLRIAQRRLINDWTDAGLANVQALLWDLALRIEEGGLGTAERDLRAAQQALQEALANGATDEEIERLMDELQQAMERYLDALAEKMQRDLAEGRLQPMPLDPRAQTIDRQQLQQMLDRAREMARGGARDAARDMLAQLQEMLENLQMGMTMPQDGEAAQAMQMMRKLDDLARRQQELMDETFRQSQRMQSGETPDTGAGAEQQEGLRQGLGEIMREFGEMTGDIPRALGRAERAMSDAVQSLEQTDPGSAVESQAEALQQLQQGAQAMAEALAQKFGDQMGMGQGQDRFGQARDPLGRNQPGNGMIDTGDVAIPEKSDLQRAREILDELRRRAGEHARPKPERDYIDRLLRRF